MEKTRFIGLEEFPPVPFDPLGAYQQKDMVRYLKNSLSRYLALIKNGQELMIPSVSEFAMLFLCPEVDVYEALKALRREGYGFEYHDFYRPLRVTYKPKEPVDKPTSVLKELWSNLLVRSSNWFPFGAKIAH